MSRLSRFLPALLCLLLSTNAVKAALTQDPALHWKTLTTKHFEIHFHDGEQGLAQTVGHLSERVHKQLVRQLNWTPQQRTQVVLTDRFDYANGAATPLPRNTMLLLVTPPGGNSVIADFDDWLELLITHEYTHVLHLDKVSGFPATLRKLFGRNLFLFPNLLQPPWFIEGLATHHETDRARGIGRGQGSLFRGLMRQEVMDGIKPLSQVNQPLVSWPMNTTRYLYGVYFYQFVAKHYGGEKIQQLVAQYSNNLLPFAINSNSRRVLGKDLTALWQDFSKDLRAEFGAEIAQIRQAGILTGEPQTHSGYFTRSPQLADNGDIYYLQKDMQSEPRLMRLRHDKTQPEIVADVRGSHIDLHPSAGILSAEVKPVRNTNQFSDLYHIDPDSGHKVRLTWGKRYLQASWSANGQQIIAVHNELGQHALHLLDVRGNKIETLWQGNDGTIISSLDASPTDQLLVAAVWRPGSLWNLEIFDLHTRQWQRLTHNQAIETGPRFSTDGKSIVFSADYDGVFNIYRLALTDNSLSKLTNVLGVATAPSLLQNASGEQLAYLNLGNNGYNLFRLRHLSPQAAILPVDTPGPAPVSHTTRTTAAADIQTYNALPKIVPTSWFPYFQFDEVRSEVGLTTFGRDPLSRHSYSMQLGFDLDNSWLVGGLNYIYDRWNPTLKFFLNRQVLAYVDSVGNVERYRDSDTVSAEAIWPFFDYSRQWLLHAGVSSETEADKKILSALGPANRFVDRLAGLAVSYNSTRRYPRSISPSYGRQARLVAEDDDLLDSDFSGQIYSLDWREFIDLPGLHVFAARGVLGWGTDAPRNFRLGGTLETSVSPNPRASALAQTQNILGQRRYPLRGYPEGRADLRGRRLALIETGWRFPIALVERGLMTPPVGLHRIHGTLLYNWGEAWNQGGSIPSLRRGAAIEITAELVLGYWLPMDLRLGYARGFDTGGEEQAYLEARVPLF
ncbi:MAG TPA: hypothetical protein ENI97_10345 [Gammaproteobacteria bacterium]|nr:hypothetical protein [Gammaproteobacteria bacterium]